MSETTDTQKPSGLTEAAQREAQTRPVIGGGGSDAGRQAELDRELGMSDEIRKARKLFDSGKKNGEEFDKIAGRQ